jgi:hypothetical protein
MGLVKGMFKLAGTLVAGSVVVAGSAIVGTGAFVIAMAEELSESNGEPNTKYNHRLNIYNNAIIEAELSKLHKRIKKALVKNKISIEIDDDAVRRRGINVEGFYSYYDRKIVLKSNEDSIEYALLHEIGHALDHIANISKEKDIEKSYMRREILFDYDYFYSTIEEYVAQSIAYYCNGILPKESIMYNKLDTILFTITWDSIDED